jgi:nucleoside-diphosphate-sugar epimerase
LVELEGNVIDACDAAGVRRVVLSLGAGDYAKSFPSWHHRVEDKRKATRLAHCILRPTTFIQHVLTYYAPSIRKEGAFYASLGTARICYIDVRDIAAVAANALSGGEHDGMTYELNGPEALTCAEVADKIARHSGSAARNIDIPAEAQRKAMLGLGMPEWQVTALLELQEYYRGGKGGTTDGTLAGVLGRPPRTMDQFLALGPVTDAAGTYVSDFFGSEADDRRWHCIARAALRGLRCR